MVGKTGSGSSLVQGLLAILLGATIVGGTACHKKKKPVVYTAPPAAAEQYVPPVPGTAVVVGDNGPEQAGEMTTWERYGENIIYKDLSDIDFDSIPKQKIPIPSDLERNLRQPKVKDWNSLKSSTFEGAAKLGYSADDISKLSVKEVLDMCVQIVSNGLEHFEVDLDPEFIKKYGKNHPLEWYIQMGAGDCDKYSDWFIAAVNMMKEINPSLENVYVSDKWLGGNLILHQWNSIIIAYDDQLLLTHLDTNQYDRGLDLEAERGLHIPFDNNKLLATFYRQIGDFKNSYRFNERALENCESIGCRADILYEMCFMAYLIEDKEKMDYSRGKFLLLAPESELIEKFGFYYGDMLYYSYKLEKSMGNDESAEKFKDELIRKFPDSNKIKYFTE